MEVQVWEKSVIAWLNLFNSNASPIHNISQINDIVLLNVIKKIKLNFENNPVEFLKEIYPNLTESQILKLEKSADYLCAATLILIYVSLTQNADLNDIKTSMCTNLDNSVQLSILEILKKLQKYTNFFCLSYNTIKQEIFSEIFLNFGYKHSCRNSFIGDGVCTPIKQNLSDSVHGSPLQEFFQTPKRALTRKSYNMCGDGDHVKKIQDLTDLIFEEEQEKVLLQEQLNKVTQKCSDYEAKLKSKVEEINLLKLEWENDSKKNEGEINLLRNNLMKVEEEEKKQKSEISFYEKYVPTLQSNLSASTAEYEKLKHEMKLALDRCNEYELQLREATELNLKFQSVIEEKEKALQQFRDIYANFYNEEKTIDVSFANKSLDISASAGENLGVVLEVLLREENESLKLTIEETKAEKETLINEIESLKEKLATQNSAILELNFLNKKLNDKFKKVSETDEELARVQKELIKANDEMNKLVDENCKINEQYNILNSSLKDVISCEKLKKVFQINFLSLAEEFKAAQQRLEMEIKKISKLTVSASEKLAYCEKTQDEVTSGMFNFKVLKSLNSEEFNNIPEISGDYAVNGNSNLRTLLELLKKFENCQTEWSESKIQMEKTCNQINFNIISLQDKIRDLECFQKQSMKEKDEIQQSLKRAEEKMSEIEASRASEIRKLKEELEAKEIKIKEFECLILQSKQIQEELIKEREMLKKQENKKEDPKRVQENKNKDQKSFYGTETEIIFSKNDGTQSRPQQEFDDSLEEVPAASKTFDIVNLEEKNISNKTFSIKKDLQIFTESDKGNQTWVISPPPKVPVKVATKESVGKQVQGESWVVPLTSEKVKVMSASANDLRVKTEDFKITELRKEILTLTKECECLKFSLMESEQKRKKDRETYEKNYNNIRQSITSKYENQLEHLKSEMKHLYTKEMAKQTFEKNNLIGELQEQNKRYKEHIDELRNQLWDLGEKLLQEQALRRNLERNCSELKEKYENILLSKDTEEKSLNGSELSQQKDPPTDETFRKSAICRLTNAAFPTIPNEDEDEIFDNRFLEDMKTGVCKTERPEDRLKELQYRNSLCLPHLKSSYPGETQFHNPSLFKDSDLKFGNVQFGQESQSLTDSDHSMTKSLLPDSKGKKKEQTSYRKPGPPTPSKNGGRLSIQSGDLRLTPRNVLKELYDQNDKNKGTPNPLKIFRAGKSLKPAVAGGKDENTAPVTPRKKIKFFRKPFGARDH